MTKRTAPAKAQPKAQPKGKAPAKAPASAKAPTKAPAKRKPAPEAQAPAQGLAPGETKPNKRARPRPSMCTPKLLDHICERLSRGETLADICRPDEMPHADTVRLWARKDAATASAIARARELGHDAIADQCLEISDEEPKRSYGPNGSWVDSGDIAHKRLKIDTRLKLLAKWNPKKYGDKIEVEGKLDQVHTIRFKR